MESESTIDDIIKTVERFRILSVGRSGVGKSSLINRVFGITDAQVEHTRPGESDIQREFVSRDDNRYFVLHDSKGFEPGDVTTFETVRKFIQERSQQNLPLKDRIHGLWLCIVTPTAGGRVIEAGDEKVLLLADEAQIPVVIVFTQYDRLVRTKKAELRQEYGNLDVTQLNDRSEEEAHKAFSLCVQSLQRTMNRLRIQAPHVKVSVRPNYQEDVSALVENTRDIVKQRLKGDAWIMWAIAQRASLPVKIEACITKGLTYYKRALTGTVPGLGPKLLRDCLTKVHKDIITCWNFKGEVLGSREFHQLMLHLVQDVEVQRGVPSSSRPDVDKIAQFVSLVTAASVPIAPPVAILGLTYVFVQWLSTAFLEDVPEVQRLLIAYTVDLISVLKELFDITLKPDLALTTTWKELQHAFEAYERSPSCRRIHNSIYSTIPHGELLTVDGLSKKIRGLLQS